MLSSSPKKKLTFWDRLWQNRYLIALAIIALALCIFFYPFSIAGVLGVLAYIGMGAVSMIVGAACGWLAKKLAGCHKAIEFVLDVVMGAAIFGVTSLFCPPLTLIQLYSFTATQVTALFSFCLGGLLTGAAKICRCLFFSGCCTADDTDNTNDPIIDNDLNLFHDDSDKDDENRSLLDSHDEMMQQNLQNNSSNEDDREYSQIKRPKDLNNITISPALEDKRQHDTKNSRHSSNKLLDIVQQDKTVETTPSPLPNQSVLNNRCSGSRSKKYKDSLDFINDKNNLQPQLTNNNRSSDSSQYNHFHRPTSPFDDGLNSDCESLIKEKRVYKRKMATYKIKSKCCCCFLWCKKKESTHYSRVEQQSSKQKRFSCFPCFWCCNRDDTKPEVVANSEQQNLNQRDSDKSNYINTDPNLQPITESISEEGTVYLDGYRDDENHLIDHSDALKSTAAVSNHLNV